jgi:hypothetical protein
MALASKASPLKDDACVISADEKTGIQAHRRKHPTRPLPTRHFDAGFLHTAAQGLHPNDFANLESLAERTMRVPPGCLP